MNKLDSGYNSSLSQREREIKQTADRAVEKYKKSKQEASQWRIVAITGAVVVALITLIIICGKLRKNREVISEKPTPSISTTVAVKEENAAKDIPVTHAVHEEEHTQATPAGEQEDFENQRIEEALYEQGYFWEDIPLDADTQACLRAACDEFSIDYALALAVIHQETRFQNVVGNKGRSVGYMQIQPRWHRKRMAELGVTDLSDPYGNFRVGCSYLRELLDQYGTKSALTTYKSGSPGNSAYATAVMAYMESLKEVHPS